MGEKWPIQKQLPVFGDIFNRGIILSRTRVKKGPFKIGPPVIGYIFSYNQLCEVDHH